MVFCVTLSLRLPWNHHLRRRLPPWAQPPLMTTRCALSKRVERFLSSLVATTAADDPSPSDRLIRKFVHSSSKSIALDALSCVLSPENPHPQLPSVALTMYRRITEASWFNWNPKIVADLIASLDKRGESGEAQSLLSEAIARLEHRERDLALFYCSLIESHSKRKSKAGFFDSCARLKQFVDSSCSAFLKRRAFESMVGGLCVMDLPREAEELITEMKDLALRPSLFEFRSLIYAYGRLGFFEDMRRNIAQMEREDFVFDTVAANMVLSSLGTHGELTEMALLLQRMKRLGVPFTIRTYNSVLNSCPAIISMLRDLRTVPVSILELMQKLGTAEHLLVQELIDSSVLVEAMEWNCHEAKLDLHGMHLASAYLTLLQWKEELRSRFHVGEQVIPAEVTVVCGSGKHSIVRGKSPVRNLVKQMMIRMDCPMRIDRKNIGCFIAKGMVMKKWLNY